MVDRLAPYPSAALEYVGATATPTQIRADLDYMDMCLRMHGDAADQTAARARMQAREPVGVAQLAANRDFVDARIRIAKRW